MNPIEKYESIFMQLFGVGKESLNENFTFEKTDNWDSMAHMELISELEDAFGVFFDTNEILNFGSYENGIKILAKHGVEF